MTIDEIKQIIEDNPVNISHKDPNRVVRAYAIDPATLELLATGINTIPRYQSYLPYRDKEGETYKYVIHAEEDLILNLNSDKSNLILIVTYPPCLHCSALIAHSFKFNSVYVVTKDIEAKNLEGMRYLRKEGIEVCLILE